MRIVSLLPAGTEIVCALGLGHSLVGVSHECDYPADPVAELPKLTSSRLPNDLDSQQIDRQVRELSVQNQGLFQVDQTQLLALQPDLILGQSLCDLCAVSEREIEAIVSQMPTKPRLVQLGATNLEEMLADIMRVGSAAGAELEADQLVNRLRIRIEAVHKRSAQATQATRLDTEPAAPKPLVLLLEWIEPLFSAGHWNPELIQLAGGRSALGRAGEKSRSIAWEEVLTADPDFLIVACCGHSIDRTLEDLPRLVGYRDFGRLKCIERGQVFVADGSQYFNRPGPRLIDSLELLAHALDSQLHPLPEHVEPAVRMKRA